MYFKHQRKHVVDRVEWNKELRLEALEDRRMLAVMLVTDLDDGTLGSLAGDGSLSLREAVEAINTGAPVDGIDPVSGSFGVNDTIMFRSSLFGGVPKTLDLSAGQLELSSQVTIVGPAARLLTIDAQQGSRIFEVTATSGDFAFNQIILTGGLTAGLQQSGGAIRSLTMHQLQLDSVDLIGNGTTGSFSDGGAISAEGSVNIVNTRIADNFTEGASGSGGGGVFVNGDVTFTRSTVVNNRTEGNFSSGGGINSNATVTLNSSTVSGNRTLGLASSAGGILGSAGIELIESTVSGNQTEGDSASAGGISSSGVINVTRSTIVDNSTRSASSPGGGIFVTNTDIHVSGSIVANNTAGGGNNDIEPGTGILSVSFSLIGDAMGLSISPATNILDQDPLLGDLADNGSLTASHLPLTGSPAIDAGNMDAISLPMFDQRGIPFRRVADGDGNGSFVIDMGSVEVQTPAQPNADFDYDDDVDGADFLRWQLGFGILVGATRADGDSDRDGDVDADDLGNWDAQYSGGATQPEVASSEGRADLMDLAIAVEWSGVGDTDLESASILQPVTLRQESSRDQRSASSMPATAAQGVQADVSERPSQSSIDAALEEQMVVSSL